MAADANNESKSELRPSWWKRQFHAHRGRLIRINDTPHSVALGSAIGMFFGFTPLFGLKTLLSILIAWIFKSNKIAAAVMVTLHDLILPFLPVILFWEYKMGMWVLQRQMPAKPRLHGGALRDYIQWTTFFTYGKPTLIGSLFFALPSAVILYFFLRPLLARAHLTRKGD
ncbi:MAG: DUF2062 domain-containing protein [Verrucomicrobiota bacterium]|nr:DUF2062 domain-containing protein [Verrucomicrobiota bacterium]